MAKILDLITGGHPDSLDDLLHLQEAQQEGQAAVFMALGLDLSKSYILQGCEISEDDSGFATTTAGLILHNGEVFEVEAQSVPDAENYGWAIEETSRPNNPVIYANGNAHAPHKIRKMKLVNTITQATILHQNLWHTKVMPGTEEGIVAGFDLKKPFSDSLIFNAERTGNQSDQTEIICQGKKWQVAGDIVLSFPPPDSLPNSHYNGEEYQMYCQPNKWQDALEFLVAEEALAAHATFLGKVTLDDSYEPTGANVQELYATNEEYEPRIRIETYKTKGRLVRYFPVHSYADKTDFEAWVRIAQPIKEAIDTKLQQSLYAEVEFREHRYPFRVSLFGYLAFADVSSPQRVRVLANMNGEFIPQSAKRISTGIYRSADRLNTYQLITSNISADLSDTELNLINPPTISNMENSDIMHFLGIFATYFI
ncbi:hypothetical protein [Microscilla marina]|uniref:Uncharacterized protein n=1 Tax=Microscilla marina ATCC 23134 TaxID=313606 RepID=A1ZIF6_MICM2|nr:hypothetical protein [Microscilla marina]EAY29824.1 hypothetical protein M23134_05697 [Microscilla marina ATCC 23134]